MTLRKKGAAAALLTLCVAGMSHAAPAVSFFPDAHATQAFPCGDTVSKMEIADFNGDGKADVLASSNKGLHVLFGNGDGSLQQCVTLASDVMPDFVAVDLDHDGTIDVIGWTEQGALLFYRGLGTSVMSPVTLVKYDHRTAFTVADLNADKLLDVIVSGPLGPDNLPRVAILLGQSGGGFSSPTTVQLADSVAGDSISQLTPWDVDHDGHLDILTFVKSGLQMLKGDGRGGLQRTDTVFGVSPGIVADFDNDGYPDVAVSSYTGDLSITFGSSSGWNRRNSIRLFQTDSLLADDVDGDGFTDLIGFRRGIFAVLRNRGDGTFASPTAWFSNFVGYSCVMGDLHGNGRHDLIFTGVLSNQLGFQVVSSLAGGRYDATAALLTFDPDDRSPLYSRKPHDVFVADVDHDGHPDLIVITVAANITLNFVAPEIIVFRNTGEGRFTRWQTLQMPEGFFLSAAVGDFDGDGNLDVAIVPLFAAPTLIFFGNYDGTFFKQSVSLPGAAAPVTYDFFHEGRAQLVFGSSDSMRLASVTRNGTVDYTAGWPGPPGWICDLNGDGLLDNVSTIIVKNLGRTSCIAAPSPFNTYNVPFMGDIDGDGRADAVTSLPIAGSDVEIQTWHGRGDFTFAAPNYYGTSVGVEGLADVDGDGKADLLIDKGVLISRGDGSFVADGTLQDGHLTAFGDFNGDGIPDAAVIIENAVVPLISHPVQIGSLPVSLSVAVPEPRAVYGAGIRVTPEVTSAFGVPTGSITFREGARLWATMLAEADASVTLPLGAGAHSITVDYSGDTRFAPSSSAFACQVDKDSSPIMVSVNGSVSSLPVSLTASFGRFADSRLDFMPATGTFTFYNGQQVLGVRSAASKASVNVTAAQNGQIHVDYSGDDNRPAGNIFLGNLTLYAVPLSPADSRFTVTPVSGGYDLDVELRGAGGTALNLDPAKLPIIDFVVPRGNLDQQQYRGNGHIGTVLHLSRASNEELIISAAIGPTVIGTAVLGPQPRLRAARPGKP
jgi:hypothetical protein